MKMSQLGYSARNSADSCCEEIGDRCMAPLRLLWEGCTAVWWFDFEDGKAAVAKITDTRVMLIRSV